MADSAGGYERPVMKMAAARPLAAALLTLAFVACGAPSPVTGTDKAKPSKTASHPPSSLVASPEAVSQAVVAAWARNDRGTIEQLTTATGIFPVGDAAGDWNILVTNAPAIPMSTRSETRCPSPIAP